MVIGHQAPKPLGFSRLNKQWDDGEEEEEDVNCNMNGDDVHVDEDWELIDVKDDGEKKKEDKKE